MTKEEQIKGLESMMTSGDFNKAAAAIPVYLSIKNKPLTVFDAIRGMSVEDTARYLSKVTITCPPNGRTRKTACKPHGCEECWTEYLNSPYTKEDGE